MTDWAEAFKIQSPFVAHFLAPLAPSSLAGIFLPATQKNLDPYLVSCILYTSTRATTAEDKAMSTNYQTIAIYSVADLVSDGRLDANLVARINDVAAGRNMEDLTIVADYDAGPWGVLAMGADAAACALRALPGADTDGTSDDYFDYCDTVEAMPEYLGAL